jgi:hypothetical protein
MVAIYFGSARKPYFREQLIMPFDFIILMLMNIVLTTKGLNCLRCKCICVNRIGSHIQNEISIALAIYKKKTFNGKYIYYEAFAPVFTVVFLAFKIF